MKKFLIATLVVLMGVAMNSCENDVIKPDGLVVSPTSILDDPENLGATFCYVLDTTDFQMLDSMPQYYFPEKWYDAHKPFYDSISALVKHEPLNYGNLCILLCQGRVGLMDANELQKDNWAQSQFKKLVEDACSRLTYTPEEKWKLHKFGPDATKYDTLFANRYSLCRFSTARHTGNFTIKADKTLFGKPAGTDLSKHFLVKGENKCMPQGTLDNFSQVFWYDQDEPEMNARQFFAKDTWLQEEVLLWLAEIPEEKYDNITFSIQMPAICEYRKRFFRENLAEVPVMENVYEYECKVTFGQKSTFRERFKEFYNANPEIEWKRYINLSLVKNSLNIPTS